MIFGIPTSEDAPYMWENPKRGGNRRLKDKNLISWSTSFRADT
jgi:hypothetical protein